MPNKVLLVEGMDEIHVLGALFYAHKLPDEFEMRQEGGIDGLIETLDVIFDERGIKRVGIVVDADDNVEARWASVRGKLRAAGYRKLPARPDPTGTIITQDEKPTVGVWIMPDNRVPGMLEHFVQFLVPAGDTLWPRARKCLEECQDEHRFPAIHFDKAHLHTWLAWQEVPGRPMGQAITLRYLQSDAGHAQIFVSWIQRLFLE
jgi:hypothetical protein